MEVGSSGSGESILTLERVLALAKQVVDGKSISYVGAAKQMSEWLLMHAEGLQAAMDRVTIPTTLAGPGECQTPTLAAGYILRPKIVCLCGSTRFGEAFAKANLDETLKGNIVLTVGCMTHSDEQLSIDAPTKLALDELHKHKIDLCDEVLVLNVLACKFCKKPRIIDGEPEYRRCFGVNVNIPPTCEFEPYIGDSTRSEIEYAEKLGKPVRYLNEVKP